MNHEDNQAEFVGYVNNSQKETQLNQASKADSDETIIVRTQVNENQSTDTSVNNNNTTTVSEKQISISDLNVPTNIVQGLQDIPWATARFLVTHNTFWCRILHFPAEILINYGAYMFVLSVLVSIGDAFGLFDVFFIIGLALNVSIAVIFTVQAFCSGSLVITLMFFCYHGLCVIASFYWIESFANTLDFYYLIGIPVIAGLTAAASNSFIAHKLLTGEFPVAQEPNWMPRFFDVIFGMFSIPFFDSMSFIYEYGWFGISEFDQKKCAFLSKYYKPQPCCACGAKNSKIEEV